MIIYVAGQKKGQFLRSEILEGEAANLCGKAFLCKEGKKSQKYTTKSGTVKTSDRSAKETQDQIILYDDIDNANQAFAVSTIYSLSENVSGNREKILKGTMFVSYRNYFSKSVINKMTPFYCATHSRWLN